MVNELQEVQWAYLIDPCFQIENTAGRPNTGGWINIYIAGTRTKYYAASDFTGTLHPFNIPLDSLGSNIILVSPANKYDIYVMNKFGTLVMSRYNVSPQVAGTSIVSGGVVLDSSDGTITIEQTGDNVYDLSVADIIDSVTANIDESITNIEGDITEINEEITNINNVVTGINHDITEINQDITNITNVVTGLPTHGDVYDAVVTGIDYTINTVTGLIPQAQVQSDWDETDPSDPAYILNKPDLDNYVTEQELIEVVSGISGVSGLNLEYGQFYSQSTTGGAVMGRTKGNIEVTNDGKIKLKKGQSYHVTVRGGYSKTTASADYNVLSYIEYITGQNINVNVDNSVTDTQYFEISYDLYKLSSDKNYYVFFSLPTGSSVNNLFIEIHSIGCMGTGGSGSGVPVEYDAGWGINIIDNVISVDPSILNQYVTQEELATAIDNVIDTVTGMIPEAQVQADWDETDPFDPSYINNKPDLDNYVTNQELIEAISGVTGTNFQNVVEYVDAQTTPNFFNDCVALLEQGIEPVAKYQGNVYQLWRTVSNGLTYTALGFICVHYLDFQYSNISYDHQFAYNAQIWADANGVYPGGDRMGYNYLAGDGLNAVTGIVNGEHAITYSIDPMEVATAVSGLIPTGSNYSAGDNIVIDNDIISVSNPATFVGESDTGYISVGNITRWNEFTEAPGIVLKSHTSSVYPGGETDFEWHVTPDHAHQAMAWGEYDVDYETNTVSATKYMTIGEGDIVYASGAFQDTNTLPVIWSCSQMAQDISELQEAITAVSGSFVQEQSDWAEQDSTKVDYIKNKPVEKQLIAGTNIDISESATGVIISASGSTYTAGNGIDITNDEISTKLGANMSFDSNDAITVDLTGVAEDAAGLVSGNIPQMELIAGNRIQIATSGVSAVINAVIPDAAKDAIFANSYDNPGWETTGTVTTYNPLGIAIHPDLAYDSYTISCSRLAVKEIGSGLYYLDLFIAMTGTPKADYATYQNYVTITNGHFVCPTNSNVYDEWNSCFGSIHQDTLYGTGLDFNATKPYDATRKHYVQLHTIVANW